MSAPAPTAEPRLLVDAREAHAAAEHLGHSARVAFDLESNGLFAYRARVCTVQLATDDEVLVLDALATPVTVLADLLASPDTVKIVHDVSFDARILAEAGIQLANVRDTSIAARMLGRTSTGLASLLASELGLSLDKKMQHHDWSERPLHPEALAYLAGDVVSLARLCDRLFDEVEARGIALEVDEETRYRLAQAHASVDDHDPRPPYIRLKGIDKVPEEELPVLRRLADVRERKARDLDVPPYKVLGPDVLFAIARARPRTFDELSGVRGATSGRRARSIAQDVLRAVREGLADGGIPEEDRALLDPPRPPAAYLKARRAREQRLSAWRRAEAKLRAVDEQVVLPGHCLQDLASLEDATLDAVAAVPGLGGFRVERYGSALLAALRGSAAETAS